MLEIDKKLFVFRKKNIWFSDAPFDVKDADVVYFYACRSRVEGSGYHCQEASTMTIDLSQDLDTIWGNMGKKSCRYYIKRAEREGITVRVNQDFDAFHSLYASFVDKKGFDTTSESVDFMKRYGTLFMACRGDEPLAGALMLQDDEHMRWLFGASARLENSAEDVNVISCANRLAIWEAIQEAKRHGRREFDLGGYYTGDDPDDPQVGINRFKEKFGGQLVTYYTYWKYNSWIYSTAQKLGRLARKGSPATS